MKTNERSLVFLASTIFFSQLASFTPANAFTLSFSNATCHGATYAWTMVQGFEKQANFLSISLGDEQVDGIDISGKISGSRSFQSIEFPEAGVYTLTATLSNQNCALLASDGSCYDENLGKVLDQVTIAQEFTCSDNGGHGTDDNDANDPDLNPDAQNDPSQPETENDTSPLQASQLSALALDATTTATESGYTTIASYTAGVTSSLATPGSPMTTRASVPSDNSQNSTSKSSGALSQFSPNTTELKVAFTFALILSSTILHVLL